MNISESLTKKVNMEQNDGLSAYMNMAAQQHHDAYEVFYEFLNDVKPKRILEIGTALGGFTKFLKKVSDELNLNINILSYDINEMGWYKDMINEGIDVRVENVFLDGYNYVKKEIIDYINGDGITIVLCDGGNKVAEFNLLSNYLKTGDFILAHDYSESREIFDRDIRGKIWNWLEISENDISESSEKNNLEFYNKDVFDKVVWVCKIKK